MKSPQITPNPTKTKLVDKALKHDLTGMNFGALVRLSFELHGGRGYKDVPVSGIEINNREEQVRGIREYIEARGGQVTYVYNEPHTSAWKKKRVKQPDGTYKYLVQRPVLDGAIRDLKLGNDPDGIPIHGLAVMADDRLARDARHMEDAIEVVEYHDKPIIDVSGLLDLLTEGGREAAGYIVKGNARYSKAVSLKVENSHRSRARLGIPRGGRAFGWQEDKRTLKKSESKLLKKAANDMLAGVGLKTIETKWAEAGILSPRGNLLNRRSIRNMLLNPRIAGISTYNEGGKKLQDRYLLDADGNYVMGQHEAIISIKKWQAVVAYLTDPDRLNTDEHSGKLKFLNSMLIRCEGCMEKISGQTRENGRHDYACKNSACTSKVSGSGIEIDKFVTAELFKHLAEVQVTPENQEWEKAEEYADLKKDKAKLLTQFKANPDMGTYIWPQVRELDVKISILTKERTAHTRKVAKPKPVGVEERWPDLELEQQRAIIAECVEAIILKKAVGPQHYFKTDRVSILFKQLIDVERIKNLCFSLQGAGWLSYHFS